MFKNHSRKVRLFWTAALLVIAVVWVILAYLVTPALIRSAYRSESLSIFNRMISGQSHLPLSEYLTRWSRLASKLSMGLIVLGTYLLLAVIGWTKGAAVELRRPACSAAMSRPRVLVVYALGVVILGGTLSDRVRETEHWPFSAYPMFSDVSRSKTLSMLRLYGVVQRSPLVEIQLDSSAYLQPFDNSRVADALADALQKNRLDEGVNDCLQRYEALRRAGRHDGPPLVAMRLYRVTWTVEDSASNIDRPDRKDLLSEVVPRRVGSD
jgi:hypothetical protein